MLRAVRERLLDPVRRLIEDERAPLGGHFDQPRAARGAARRQETLEAESIGGQRRDRQRRHQRTGTGHRDDLDTGRRAGAHQIEARIADRGRARIAHERHARAALHALNELRRALCLVVIVQGNHRRGNPESLEQHARVARIFGRDQRGTRKRFARARAQIAQVADGRRHDVQATRCQVCHYTSRFAKGFG